MLYVKEGVLADKSKSLYATSKLEEFDDDNADDDDVNDDLDITS